MSGFREIVEEVSQVGRVDGVLSREVELADVR